MSADETMEATLEPVDEFRRRARAWLAENMPGLDDMKARAAAGEATDPWARARHLQRILWEGGFAGICFPREYGGLGLTPEHQRAFTEEAADYEMPLLLNVPTFTILAATLIDVGTHEQKQRHLPAILRGEEVWVQLLSEPTGGSDLAGCLTRAEQSDDGWVLNGSKIWTSSAHVADFGMCLARTDWDVPKHQGLTMFLVDLRAPGIRIDPIRQVNGSREFCQEFLDDVALPPDAVLGEVGDGWSVASRLLAHERVAVGGGSPYASGRIPQARGGDDGVERSLIDLARSVGRADDPVARQLVAEARVLDIVHAGFVRRVGAAVRAGAMPSAASAMLKLFGATNIVRKHEIGFTLAGRAGVTWMPGEEPARAEGERYPSRQSMCLGGGSNEIQRNIISERVLGMPREWAADRDVSFREVRTNRMPTGPAGSPGPGSEGDR